MAAEQYKVVLERISAYFIIPDYHTHLHNPQLTLDVASFLLSL